MRMYGVYHLLTTACSDSGDPETSSGQAQVNKVLYL